MKIKVKDLMKQLEEKCQQIDGFEEFDVHIECVHGHDLEHKRDPKTGWNIYKDPDGWEWVNLAVGVNLINKDKKIVGISANY